VATAALPAYLERITVQSIRDQLAGVRVHVHCDGHGRQRRVFMLGNPDARRIVLLPPYGMTFILLLPLARLLASHFYVLMWESVGCPDSEYEAVEDDYSLAAQSREFADILRAQDTQEFHFVGWCQASQLAIHALAKESIRPLSISWIAPGGFGHTLIKSEFERCALPIYLEIARQGLAEASKLALILDKYRGIAIDKNFSAERLTMLHLVDPVATRVFAKYMRCFENNKAVVKELLPAAFATAVPTQIIHCRDDTYSHYSESVQLTKLFPQISLSLSEHGGHLQLFDAPTHAAEIVGAFVERHSRQLTEAVGC
jgi:pimeloyl-ACP methyl ester carboxylesterase